MDPRTSRMQLGRSVVAAILLVLVARVKLAECFRQLDYRRTVSDSRLRNHLRLGCLDTRDGRLIPGAVFFRNGELFFDLADPQPVREDRPVDQVRVVDREEILFILNRDAEGSYSCGVREGNSISRSPAIQFVALPTSQIQRRPPPPTFSSKIGSQARINCTQTPGQLIDHYFVTWRNSSSNEILAERPNPLAPLSSVNPRYSVDPVTFAFLIDDVTLLDSASIYQCELTVVNVQGFSRLFTYGRSENLELLVYEPSVITTPPESTVISAAASPNVVSFRCEAVGSATPIVTWRHAGEEVDPGSKYLITMETFITAVGGRGISSILTLLDLEVRDTGMVECVVDTPPSPETNNQRLPGDMAEAPLTVLDAYTNLVVFTTTSRDIIFSVSFPVVPLHPVQLFLRYYEVGGDGQVRDSSPSISYQNTSDINHIAFDPTVPFDKFRVEIFLYHQPQGVLGPGKNDTLVYDKDDPSKVEPFIRAVVIPSTVATSIVGVIIISILVTIMCFCHYRTKQRARDDAANYMDNHSNRLLQAIQIVKEMSGVNNTCEDKKMMLRMMADLVSAFAGTPLSPDIAVVRVRTASALGGAKVGDSTMDPLDRRIEADDGKLIEEETTHSDHEVAKLFASVTNSMLELGLTHNVLMHPLKATLRSIPHLNFIKEEAAH